MCDDKPATLYDNARRARSGATVPCDNTARSLRRAALLSSSLLHGGGGKAASFTIGKGKTAVKGSVRQISGARLQPVDFPVMLSAAWIAWHNKPYPWQTAPGKFEDIRVFTEAEIVNAFGGIGENRRPSASLLKTVRESLARLRTVEISITVDGVGTREESIFPCKRCELVRRTSTGGVGTVSKGWWLPDSPMPTIPKVFLDSQAYRVIDPDVFPGKLHASVLGLAVECQLLALCKFEPGGGGKPRRITFTDTLLAVCPGAADFIPRYGDKSGELLLKQLHRAFDACIASVAEHPEEFHARVETKDGRIYVISPMQPEDGALQLPHPVDTSEARSAT